MTEGITERRLAAIVAIDVAGYSRLMGADEDGTLAALTGHRKATKPIGEEHGGRVVGTAGDGQLWEFPSVTEAVLATIEVQAVMHERNKGIPEDRQMLFRIGINLGDVMVQDDDIFGEGVNVAARIEALAPPGTVCVSRTVRDNVRDRMDINFEDMGEVEVKNIARPVRIFRVLKEGEETVQPIATKSRLRWQSAVAAVGLLVLLIGGGLGWWWSQQPDFEPANPAKFTYKLPEKPSIAVLPFDNLTGDKSQNYLGDGLTENIISVLTSSPDLFIIAGKSTFKFKGKATKVQQVAEELGVRYVLKGGMLKSGDKIRVTAQLVDALDGKHLWAERYDRPLKDVFTIYDDITNNILQQMHVNLTLGRHAHTMHELTGNTEDYRLYKLWRSHLQTRNAAGLKAAAEIVAQLEERNANQALIDAMKGWLHYLDVRLGLSKDKKKDLELARKYGENSLSLVPRATVYMLLANLDLDDKNYKSAIDNADQALNLSPSDGVVNFNSGLAKGVSGQIDEGIQLIKLGMRLSPYYPDWVPGMLAYFLMERGDLDEAQDILEGILTSEARDVRAKGKALTALAALSVIRNRMSEAEAYIQRSLKINPKNNLNSVKRGLARNSNQDFVDIYLSALRQAGLPQNRHSTKSTKPSIAVLPFANLSDDKDQEYFADGMTDDLITDLSKVSGLIVIARNSVFTYKGKNVKVQEVAKDLNVSHVLEGSVRPIGNRLRINAQLIDAKTGDHLWADRFDGPMDDLFDFQNTVMKGILEALKLKLMDETQSVFSKLSRSNPEAYKHFVVGRKASLEMNYIANNLALKASQNLTKARQLAPHDPYIMAELGWFNYRSVDVWSGGAGYGNKAKARSLADLSLNVSTNPRALMLKAVLLYDTRKDDGAALEQARAAFELAPNDILIIENYASMLLRIGNLSAAEKIFEKGKQLAPVAWTGLHHSGLGLAYLLSGKLTEAEKIFRQSPITIPVSITDLYLAATLALSSKLEHAKSVIDLLPKRDCSYAACNAFGLWNELKFQYGFRDETVIEPVFLGLRKAGFLEEPE